MACPNAQVKYEIEVGNTESLTEGHTYTDAVNVETGQMYQISTIDYSKAYTDDLPPNQPEGVTIDTLAFAVDSLFGFPTHIVGGGWGKTTEQVLTELRTTGEMNVALEDADSL